MIFLHYFLMSGHLTEGGAKRDGQDKGGKAPHQNTLGAALMPISAHTMAPYQATKTIVEATILILSPHHLAN